MSNYKIESGDYPHLAAKIEQYCIKYGDFILSSGQHSDIYVDMRKLSMEPSGITVVGRSLFSHFLAKFPEEVKPRPEVVCGVAEGGIPLVAAFLARVGPNLLHGPFHGCWIRKDYKAYGTKKAIEGYEIHDGCPVVLLEDVVTTGESSAKAIKILHESGALIFGVIALLDRSGVKEPFEQYNVPYYPLTYLQKVE